MAGYTSGHQIIGKKVLENSFGDGNILVAIVAEYIKACNTLQYSLYQISRQLETDVYGIELDTELFEKTISRLNKLTDAYGIPRVSWKLFNTNALEWNSEQKFDFIIGNPPYIEYSDISESDRAKIRNQYSTCRTGKFDYYYAFIESAIEQLSPRGKLVQLVPNSIYKNVFAEELRERLCKHISQINIYPTQKIFKDALTSTSIFLYDSMCADNNVTCI